MMTMNEAYVCIQMDEVFPHGMLFERDFSGNSLAHLAASTGDASTIYKLGELGLDLTTFNADRETPADVARRCGHDHLGTVIEAIAQQMVVDAEKEAAPKEHWISRFCHWAHAWKHGDWALGFGHFDGAYEAHFGPYVLRFAQKGL